MNIYLESAIDEKTNVVYKLGDHVLVYQGRLGHNNVMQIGTIMSTKEIFNGECITVIRFSKKIIKEDEINDSEKLKGNFSYLSSIKKKIDYKELKNIKKSLESIDRYAGFKIIN